MTNFEIKEQIDQKNLELEKEIRTSYFTLNKKVEKLNEEISELRGQCTHEFENGMCKYCGIPKEFCK